MAKLNQRLSFKHISAPSVWAVPVFLSIGLLWLEQINFILFHTFVELFTIIISFMMFTVAWPTFSFSRNNVLIFLAAGYFWIAVLDSLHALVYKGMNILPLIDDFMSIDFWMGARFLEATVLILAPLLASKKLNHNVILGSLGLLSIGFITIVFTMPHALPEFFIEGEGLTANKVNGEVLLVGLYLIAGVLFYRIEGFLNARERTLILMAIGLTIMAEVTFTRYADVYDYYNIAGHLFKLFSFWMLFRSLVYSTLQRPYQKLEQVQSDSRLADVVLTNLHAGIWSYDPLYGRLSMNETACEWMGCKPTEKLSLDRWINRIPEDDRKDVEDAFVIAMKKGEPFEWTHPINTPDGDERMLHVTGRPILNARGDTVIGLYGMMVDITDDGARTTP